MDIPPEIAFKDTDSSEALEQLIRDRIDRLEQFHPHIVSVRAVVHVPHRRSTDTMPPLGLAVEVALPGSRMVVAKDETERSEAAGGKSSLVGRVFDRIERQIKDHGAIDRGQVKAHAADGTTGRVVRLFPEQNYGFIEIAGSPDLYFTRNAVLDGSYDDLAVGAEVRVTVATTEGPMGPQASSVRPLGGMQELR
jgi:cold shock CspA family protein/ribosome-associated translation inhibitor RaiA